MSDEALLEKDPVEAHEAVEAEESTGLGGLATGLFDGASRMAQEAARVALPALDLIGAGAGALARGAAEAAARAAGQEGCCEKKVEAKADNAAAAKKELEKLTKMLAHTGADAIADSLRNNGQITPETMQAIGKYFRMAGEAGGANNQQAFIRQMTIALADRGYNMLHAPGQADVNGLVPHRIVVTKPNGTMVGDGTFKAKAR